MVRDDGGKDERERPDTTGSYHALFDALPDPAFLVTPDDGRIIDVNPLLVSVYGYSSRAEMIGMSSLLVSAEPDATAKTMRDGVGRTVYLRMHRRKDGTVFPAEVSFGFIHLDGRRVALGIIRDVSERLRAEHALRMSEEKFGKMFASSPIATTVSRMIDGRYLDVNDTFTTMVGIPREEALSSTSVALGLWANDADRESLAADLRAGRPVVGRECNFRSRTRGLLTCLFSAQAITLGDEPCILGSIHDITDRKRAEEAFLKSQQTLAAAFASMTDAVFVADAGGRLVTVNEAFAVLHRMRGDGTPDSGAPAYPDGIEMVTASGEVVRAEMWPVARALRGDATKNEEYTLRRQETGETWKASYSFGPIRGDAGAIVGAVVVGRDITDRVHAVEQRAELEHKLQQAQKLEAVGRLAGGVAHDFNNMLSVILGHTELALRHVDPGQPLHDDLDEIRKAGLRSADLTRQLLAFARRQTIAPKVVDVNEASAGTLKMLERLVGEGIQLIWSPGGGLWPVKIDPSQLDQLLANLCINGRDAISGTGSVAIATGNRTIAADYCASHPDAAPGDYVWLSVADDGQGMDDEIIGQIFEPFFTTKPAGRGTGLGLATVHGIVKQNGGFITVVSRPKQGTTFTVFLPRHTGQLEAPPKGAASQSVRGNETILVVEDEPAILNVTTMLLEAIGYIVLPANSAAEALRLASAYDGEICLLLTDVVMPEMNGRELASMLLKGHPRAKRLFMSGYTADVIANHGVLDEGVAFIEKPFSQRALATKVREVLDAGR